MYLAVVVSNVVEVSLASVVSIGVPNVEVGETVCTLVPGTGVLVTVLLVVLTSVVATVVTMVMKHHTMNINISKRPIIGHINIATLVWNSGGSY